MTATAKVGGGKRGRKKMRAGDGEGKVTEWPAVRVRLRPDLYAGLQARAAEKGHTLNAEVAELIEAHAPGQG